MKNIRKLALFCILLITIPVLFLGEKEYRDWRAYNELTQYIDLYNEWYIPARQLQEDSGNLEALKVLQFLDTYGAMAKPLNTPSDLVETLETKPEVKVAITILTDNDHDTNLWIQYAENGFASFYYPGNPGIISLKPSDVTDPTLRGLILIHEGFHVLRGASTVDSEEEMAFREREAYQIEFDILHATNPEFEKSAKTYSTLMIDLWNTQQLLTIYEPEYLIPEIEKVFGTTTQMTETDKTTYSILLWLDSVFMMYDELEKDPLKNSKDKEEFIIKSSRDGVMNLIEVK